MNYRKYFSSPNQIKKGDTLYMVRRANRSADVGQQVTVTTVGRKYIKVSAGHNENDVKFDKETLEEATDYSRIYYLFPNEQAYLNEVEYECISKKLFEFFSSSHTRNTLTLEQLRQIKAIVEPT